jgi:hypothetical protein
MGGSTQHSGKKKKNNNSLVYGDTVILACVSAHLRISETISDKTKSRIKKEKQNNTNKKE